LIKNMTFGNPPKLIIAFSIPLLVGNIFQQFYNLADMIIVGKIIGVSALAAVGATAPIFFLLLNVIIGLTSGFSVITAQRFGAKDESGVRRSVATSVSLSLFSTAVITVMMIAIMKPLLILMNVPEDIFADSYSYISIICYGIFVMFAYNLLSSIMRALGDSKTPLYFLIFSSLLNIVLALLFIRNGMGVAGSAFAAVVAQGVSSVFCLLYISKKFPILRLHKEDWGFDYRFAWQHARIALPMALQFSITALGMMLVQGVCNTFGPSTIAAFTAALRIEQIAVQPMISFGVAIATYTAQNYGAKMIGRIRQGVLKCSAISMVFSIAIAAIIYFFAEDLAQLFISDYEPEVVIMAKTYLNISTSFYFFLGQLFIYRNTLQGLGKTVIPVCGGLLELVLRLIAAIYLAKSFGYIGICYASPISWTGAALLVAIGYFIIMKKLSSDMTQVTSGNIV
jgi:putative MATE family efflux protein